MKLSAATIFTMAMATTEAFAPSKIQSSPQSTALFAKENNNNLLPKIDAKSAASLVAASVFAFSTVGVTTTAIPAFVEPAFAAAKVEAKKEAPKKLSGEEKDLLKAKSNADLAGKTLKSFEQLSSDAKAASKKAQNELGVASKNSATAKNAAKAATDKLNAAKKQKMPSSAIKELSVEAGTRTRIAACLSFATVQHRTNQGFVVSP
jgi:hypothetical protein